MSGVISLFGTSDPVQVAYFEDTEHPDTIRLAAAVIWLGVDSPRRWSMRRMLRRARAYFGPLGIGLHLRWNFRAWTGSTGANGEQETLFDRERRIVRVLGRDFLLPEDGQTLVLMIDERAGGAGGNSVAIRNMAMPTVSRRNDSVQAAQQSVTPWISLLQQDSEVREFMGMPADGGSQP
jgi:hypothetical protein